MNENKEGLESAIELCNRAILLRRGGVGIRAENNILIFDFGRFKNGTAIIERFNKPPKKAETTSFLFQVSAANYGDAAAYIKAYNLSSACVDDVINEFSERLYDVAEHDEMPEFFEMMYELVPSPEEAREDKLIAASKPPPIDLE